MRHYSCYIKAASLILLLLLTVGCVERELTERPSVGILRVGFSWPGECGVTGARIWLDDSEGRLLADEQCDAYGYAFHVAQGVYSICSVNTDMINADCTGSQTVRAREDREKGILLNVGKVYCAGEDRIAVSAGSRPTEVTLHPENVVKTIRFILYTEDAGPFDMLELRLSGIVPSVRICDGDDAGEPVAYGGTTVGAGSRASSSPTYAAEMSVFGWRGENLLTATIYRSDGSVETSVPQEIGDFLDQSAENGIPIRIVLNLPGGREIALSVTVNAWQSGTGSGTVE